MRHTLQLEELAQLGLGIVLYSLMDLSWWWFVGLFFVPDIGMLGYLVNTKVGAFMYNLFHHKGVAIGIGMLGYFLDMKWLLVAGIILFAHSAFDRMLGYGLKLIEGFSHTHLGKIGKN